MIQELFGETKIPSFTTASSLGNGSGGILLHPPTTTASTTTRTTATTAGTHPPNSFASSTSENLRCPRCDSTNTKFCYYNNYNLTQPRHFCKTCRRYWTKGGTLRNIPIGGGCRKNRTTTATASAAAFTTLGKPNPTSKPRISTNNTISTFSPETLYGKSTGHGFQFDLPLTPALWPNFSNNSHIFSLLRSTHHSNPNPNPNPSPSTLGTNSSAFPLKNDTVFGTNSTNITTMLGLDSYNQAQQGQNEGLQMNVNVMGSSSSWNCHGDHQQGDHVGNVNMMGSSVGSGGSSSTTMELGSGTGQGFSYLINQGLSWSSDHLPPPIGGEVMRLVDSPRYGGR